MQKKLASVVLTGLLMLGVSVNAMAGAAATDLVCTGCVGTTDIANAAVTDTKLGTSAVTSTKIADGAVTDAKISGQISASKIQKLANVVTVATSGGDFTTISAALASITNASDINRYVIRVLPGIYNEDVTMKSYVDIVGSGKENTKITSSTSSAPVGTFNATVVGASNSTIENIWVEHTGAAPTQVNATGILIGDNITMTINKVKITTNITGPMSIACGIGSYANTPNSKITISNSDISVAGRETTGISLYGASVLIDTCNISIDTDSASYYPNSTWNAGLYKVSGTVRNSTIKVSGGGRNYGSYGNLGVELSLSGSRVEAIATSNTETRKALHGAFNAYNSELVASVGTATNVDCAIEAGSVGGSLIDGIICGAPKVVNSWDGAFNPIPNQ